MISKVVLKGLRKIYVNINKNSSNKIDLTKQPASDLIKNSILSGKPLMVARVGAVEFNCISSYLNSNLGPKKYINYIKGNTDSLSIDENVIKQAYNNAGIFPPEKMIVEKFSQLMLKDLNDVDILGLWLKEENVIGDKLSQAKKIPLKDIEPYYHQFPWSEALKSKNVLVIHPFSETINNQLKNYNKLFSNKKVLPKFNIITYKSVQSIAGSNTEFNNWFEALDSMKRDIEKINFDIAIIGCGAYGFPLAAHIKRMGKQAIHMGGATQILFGIKGARWDNHPIISTFYNDYWVRPSNNETPNNKNTIEDGCYW